MNKYLVRIGDDVDVKIEDGYVMIDDCGTWRMAYAEELSACLVRIVTELKDRVDTLRTNLVR